MNNNIYIGIAGMMGSGKTTLAKKISLAIGLEYLPKELNSKKYLNDLFESTNRWALEAQVSFLVEKSAALIESLKKNSVVLDRTFDEDMNVFAKYFYEDGAIDSRGYATYQTLSQHYIDSIPKPLFVIYCECELKNVFERIKKKARGFQEKYPAKHIEDIYRYYIDWFNDYNSSAIYVFDSNAVDLTASNIGQLLADDINFIMRTPSTQIDLFSDEPRGKLSILKEKIPYKGKAYDKLSNKYRKSDDNIPAYPYAYIAAPFTSIATVRNVKNDMILFDSDVGHGEIPDNNPYRMMLEEMAKILRKHNINTLIPHRDINQWGKKKISSADVYRKCLLQVENCDLFIGIFGLSPGVHLEYGYAHAKGTPCVIIRCKEIESSYISNGIPENQENMIIINVEKMSDIVHAISSIDFNKLIDSML
jgi:deoxyadenosine/deoxycytidine kinase